MLISTLSSLCASYLIWAMGLIPLFSSLFQGLALKWLLPDGYVMNSLELMEDVEGEGCVRAGEWLQAKTMSACPCAEQGKPNPPPV